jgi:hypothetical protein
MHTRSGVLAAALALGTASAAADHCFHVPGQLGSSPAQDGACPAGQTYYPGELCWDSTGDQLLMIWPDGELPRCLSADELAERARSACAAGYESASIAHIDEAWPALAVRQYAAGNPPGPRVACYAADLARVDAALSAAVADLDGLTAEQMTPCPAVTWPEMRYYTDADIAAGAEPCAD